MSFEWSQGSEGDTARTRVTRSAHKTERLDIIHMQQHNQSYFLSTPYDLEHGSDSNESDERS